MTLPQLLWFVGGVLGISLLTILLILWRVERFLHRVLAYIKADSVYGAEEALKPKVEILLPDDEVTRLRKLQEQTYATP